MAEMSGLDGRRRRRRKEARPSEIVSAALEVFAECGYGAAKVEEVARRAGIAKGTVFIYFPTKQDLFRAVAKSVMATNLDRLQAAAVDVDMPLGDLIRLLLQHAAGVAESPVAAVVRLLMAEARAFPDIAQVWHDEVVAKMLGMVSGAIERAQGKGEVAAGDARLYAFSIIGPMLAGVVFREVFRDSDASAPDLHALAAQHARTIENGLMITPKRA